ncbi:unnamed protein product [Closterium sp. Naga37s-1]|nr:unnamed protein product [Closterium sp. Naga37s-1]
MESNGIYSKNVLVLHTRRSCLLHFRKTDSLRGYCHFNRSCRAQTRGLGPFTSNLVTAWKETFTETLSAILLKSEEPFVAEKSQISREFT